MTSDRQPFRCSLTGRGFTLLETLAALALLSLVAGAGGAWIIGESRFARTVTQTSDETAALARVMDALRADLFESITQTVQAQYNDDELTLLTTRAAPFRPEGWREAAWRLDNESSCLMRREQELSPRDAEPYEQVVMRDVASFVISLLDEESGSEPKRVLSVALTLTSGVVSEHVWSVAP